jgi:hypothetical protein
VSGQVCEKGLSLSSAYLDRLKDTQVNNFAVRIQVSVKTIEPPSWIHTEQHCLYMFRYQTQSFPLYQQPLAVGILRREINQVHFPL